MENLSWKRRTHKLPSLTKVVVPPDRSNYSINDILFVYKVNFLNDYVMKPDGHIILQCRPRKNWGLSCSMVKNSSFLRALLLRNKFCKS